MNVFSELVELCFNSRTPCGVRPRPYSFNFSDKKFQFTHPVWGATYADSEALSGYSGFQFTHPVWGATRDKLRIGSRRIVSIHAPRVGCDSMMQSCVL